MLTIEVGRMIFLVPLFVAFFVRNNYSAVSNLEKLADIGAIISSAFSISFAFNQSGHFNMMRTKLATMLNPQKAV